MLNSRLCRVGLNRQAPKGVKSNDQHETSNKTSPGRIVAFLSRPGCFDPLVWYKAGSWLNNTEINGELVEMLRLIRETDPSRKNTNLFNNHDIQNERNIDPARLDVLVNEQIGLMAKLPVGCSQAIALQTVGFMPPNIYIRSLRKFVTEAIAYP